MAAVWKKNRENICHEQYGDGYGLKIHCDIIAVNVGILDKY